MERPTIALCPLCAATIALATEKPKPIPRHTFRKLGWVESLERDLSESYFEAISNYALKLAVQAKKLGKNPDGIRNELNFAFSEIATCMAAARDGNEVPLAAKFSEMLGRCATCHAKLSDTYWAQEAPRQKRPTA